MIELESNVESFTALTYNPRLDVVPPVVILLPSIKKKEEERIVIPLLSVDVPLVVILFSLTFVLLLEDSNEIPSLPEVPLVEIVLEKMWLEVEVIRLIPLLLAPLPVVFIILLLILLPLLLVKYIP